MFISHCSADKQIANEVALFLVSEYIDVFYDEWDIAAGMSIIERIEKGLIECQFFILIWSQNAENSNWVNTEWKAALSKSIRKGVPIVIPIIVDSTSVPELLNDIKHLNFNDGIEETRSDLIYAILKRKPSNNYIKAVVKKYNELIMDDDPTNPVGVKACPGCGSELIGIQMDTDYYHDEVYFTFICKECGHTFTTQ